MQEGGMGTLQANKKPDVLGLFDGLLDVGQEFTYLVHLIREASNDDSYITMKLEQIIDDHMKQGDVEKFYDKIKELEEEIRESY